MLHEALRLPYCRLQVSYDDPFDPLPYNYVPDFKQLLQAEVVQALSLGDSDRAVRAVLEMLLLSQSYEDAPLLIMSQRSFKSREAALQSWWVGRMMASPTGKSMQVTAS